MNCWSLIPSARLWIERPHDAGGAVVMAYNSPLQRTGGTVRAASAQGVRHRAVQPEDDNQR